MQCIREHDSNIKYLGNRKFWIEVVVKNKYISISKIIKADYDKTIDRRKEMVNYIIVGILIFAVFLAIFRIRKNRKNGSKCMGCSMAGSCSGMCSNYKNHEKKGEY